MFKKALTLLAIPALALALNGCTSTAPKPSFNTAKPNALCLLSAPEVKSTSIKRGAELAFTGADAGCAVKYNAKGALAVNLNAQGSKETVGSILVKGSPTGAYRGKIYVPSLATPGKYTLSVAGGADQKCADPKGCDSSEIEITVTK